MSKIIFTVEVEINASPKILFPYLSTADGLQKWFADKVSNEESKTFVFVWDEEKYVARKVASKENQFVKFEVQDGNGSDPSFFEFKLEINQLTETTFLTINDYEEIDDMADYEEMYNHCLATLKELVGA